jgi:hypothetical protein
MNVRSIVEERINSLWTKFKDEEFCKYPPHSISEIPDEGLIFIGINPSLSDATKERLVKLNSHNCEFHILNDTAEKEHKYFKKCFEISKRTNLKWGHLDILYIRETKQNKIKDLLKISNGQEFIYEQCQITKSVLDKVLGQSTNRIFIVNNTFARELLGLSYEDGKQINNNEWISYNFDWSEELGTYTYNNNIFLVTSMLTGQRALDVGSFERLIWHIKFIKNRN